MTSFMLRRNVQVVPGASEHEVLLYRGGKTSVRVRRPTVDVLRLAAALQGGASTAELHRLVGDDPAERSWLSALLGRCQTSGMFLEDTDRGDIDGEKADRFDRLLAWFGIHERDGASRYDYLTRLSRARVAVLGVGSLGTWLTMHLATNGVGEICGVDPDLVESSNLSRQVLFTESDIGRSKVDAAVDGVRRLTHYSRFIPYQRRLESEEQVAELLKEISPAIAVLSADTPRLQVAHWVVPAAIRAGVPIMRVNAQGVGPLAIPGQDTACPLCDWRELVAALPDGDRLVDYQRRLKMPSTLNSATVSTEVALYASLAAQEVMHFLTGVAPLNTINARLVGRMIEASLERRPMRRDPRCPGCGPRI